MGQEDCRGALPRAPRRKRIRLDREAYGVAGQLFLLTLCTSKRRPMFAQRDAASLLFRSVLSGPLSREARLFAACLMPDHLHLLIAAADTNLVGLVNRWKTYATNLLHKMGVAGTVWQRSFYDHALRRGETAMDVASYVVNNPVRKGIVQEWRQYPYVWHAWMEEERKGRP